MLTTCPSASAAATENKEEMRDRHGHFMSTFREAPKAKPEEPEQLPL